MKPKLKNGKWSTEPVSKVEINVKKIETSSKVDEVKRLELIEEARPHRVAQIPAICHCRRFTNI